MPQVLSSITTVVQPFYHLFKAFTAWWCVIIAGHYPSSGMWIAVAAGWYKNRQTASRISFGNFPRLYLFIPSISEVCSRIIEACLILFHEHQALDSVDEFLEKLPSFDAEIEAQRKDADSSGMVLRFVGIVDVKANQGAVKLVRLPKSDPFAQLSGTDNIIAFTSKRYSKDQRLIVRGPGAGAEVTAAGVFSDLLRLASYLGAPS